MTKVKFLDVLDCIACYCKCDPLKNGVINSSAVVTLLKQRINDAINFNKGNKFKLSKIWCFIYCHNIIVIYKMAFWALGKVKNIT